MPFFFFDPTMVLLIPALLLAMWAQYKVKSSYAHFSQVSTRSGLTGSDVARRILRDAGVDPDACGLEAIPGEMTDHYDPRSQTLRLSEGVFHGRSVAALGIAAHEVGHAIQHARGYAPLGLRNVVYPVCSIGSKLAFPLFFIGLIFPFAFAPALMKAAILLFAAAVFFTLVTLPVEFNASSRALKALNTGGYLTTEELGGARQVLNAAALTYVASAAMAIMQLVRMLLIAQSRR
jgi:Zn-dependent membrane protease YugP